MAVQSWLFSVGVVAWLLHFAGLATAVGPFKNLVTFGDSYTDKVNVGDGGIAWPVYVGSYSNNSVAVYDFARSGGTCSNKIVPRPFPSVMESQIPQYDANVTTKRNGPTTATYIISPNGTYVPLASKDTLYSIWIGTNDVGAAALLTDPLKDVSIVNATACVFDWVKSLYDQGARNFLIQNMIPLYLIPMYSATGYPTKFFSSPHNQTEWSILMAELVRSGNELQALRTKYVAPSQFPGARFGLFDSYGLFKDIYEKPASYLVGPSYNVTEVINACKYPYGNSTLVCVTQPPAVRDSYLWWDELHPSEQANRVVAREILKALNGRGPFVSCERDEGALAFLGDIKLSYLTEPDLGFKLTFVFDETPFENKELEKTYFYHMYERAKGTKIKWKEDKDLKKTIEIKKQRNKNTNRTRLIRRTQNVPSFFDFFTPPLLLSTNPDLIASGEAVDWDDLTEEQPEQLKEKLEIDYQIGEDLKERVIPRAIDYFTGKALQYDQDLSDYEDDETEGSEGDSDEDSDDPPPARRAPTGPKKKGELEKAEERKNK
ncbi:hypothetical protein FRC07_001646 [Ceratobasidium sp. 392]|nr:hypothetical protein FRC07_001646 [Ceratobasidium sp. 392]